MFLLPGIRMSSEISEQVSIPFSISTGKLLTPPNMQFPLLRFPSFPWQPKAGHRHTDMFSTIRQVQVKVVVLRRSYQLSPCHRYWPQVPKNSSCSGVECFWCTLICSSCGVPWQSTYTSPSSMHLQLPKREMRISSVFYGNSASPILLSLALPRPLLPLSFLSKGMLMVSELTSRLDFLLKP